MAPQKLKTIRVSKGGREAAAVAGDPVTPAGIPPVVLLLDTPDPLYLTQAPEDSADSYESEESGSEMDVDVPVTPTPKPTIYTTAGPTTLKRTRDLVSPEKSSQPTKQQATEDTVDIGLRGSIHHHHNGNTHKGQDTAVAPAP